MLYQLKPIQWIDNRCVSPTHQYTILYDEKEQSWFVLYFNKDTQKSHTKYCKSIDCAKEWVETVHIPAKLKHYFDIYEETVC